MDVLTSCADGFQVILRITYWRTRGGGTTAAKLLAAAPQTAGILLYLESDRKEILSCGLADKEQFAHVLDFRASHRLVRHLLTKHDEVLIHSHGRRAGLHSRLCKLLFGRRVRVVHSFHGVASYAGIKRIVSALWESVFSLLTDAVIADGTAELELFRRFPPLWCPNFLIMPGYSPANVIEHSFRPVRRIGFAARMSHPKLHRLLIELIAAFNARHPETSLSLIFSGDGPLREKIDTLGQKILGSCYVSLGHVPSVRMLYTQIDAYAHFSLFEGLGISIVEAMVSGLPCIATDVIGCRDVIDSDEIGMLLPVHDRYKQLEMLENLVFDEETTRIRSEKGKASALRRFAPATCVDAHARLYSQVGHGMSK